MKITTIATRSCQQQAQDMLSSLRNSGYTGEVICYTPQLYDAPLIDCTISIAPNWWPDSSEILQCVNAPALCKPDVFLDKRWKDGDLLLYLDAADVLVNADPAGITDFLGEACLAAYPYKTDNMPFGEVNTAGKYYNNGVILARMSDDVRLFAELWKYLLRHDTKRWITGNANYRQVGDQRAFNMALRLCGIAVNDIPHDWNYRPGSQVRKLKITNDRISDSKGTEPLIIHCTGPTKMPEHLIEHCGKPETPVPPLHASESTVSVVTPAHKAAPFLERMLASIEAQTVKPLEVIIGIDACPETRDAAQSLIDRADIKYIPEHVGPYLIRNTLAERAKGEILCFFDADDEMDVTYIQDCLQLLSPGTAVYGCSRWVKDGKIVRSKHVPHGAFFVYRDEFLRMGGFEGWLCAADTDFMARAMAAGIKRVKQAVPGFTRHKHAHNLTVREDTKPGSNMRNAYQAETNRRKAENVQVIRLQTVPYYNLKRNE